MRIARAVTACGLLISAFLGAETVHSDRRPSGHSSKNHQLESKLRNDVPDISEITFTTLYPEVPPTTKKPLTNVHLSTTRKQLKIRHRSIPRMQGPDILKSNRRRRQLQRIGTNKYRFGRSLDASDNEIDHHHVETLQKPDAFEAGAIHIEPIFRVMKNKNIFDSIVSLAKQIIDPPKTQLGPLVGPFNFPGIGDKVYIRLLESVQPDNLVVRLISHLPASGIETSLPPDFVPSIDIPSANHESITLLTNAVSSVSDHHAAGLPSSSLPLDTLHSSSNNVLQVSKPNAINHVIKKPQISVVHNAQSASKFPETDPQQLVRHRKSNQHQPLPPTMNNQMNRHKNRDGPYIQTHEYPELLNQAQPNVHQSNVHPSINESSIESPTLFKIHDIPSPVNASSIVKVLASDSIPPYDPSLNQFRIYNDTIPTAEDRPRYSIEFASKKMRYLNLDGTVDAPDDDQFKPVERSPVLQRVPMPSGEYWDVIQGPKSELNEASFDRRQNMQDRSDNPFTKGRSSNGSPSTGASDSVRQPERQVARCPGCLRGKNASDKYTLTPMPVSNDPREEVESTVNNSMRLATTTVRSVVDSTSIKSTLSKYGQLESSTNDSSSSRNV